MSRVFNIKGVNVTQGWNYLGANPARPSTCLDPDIIIARLLEVMDQWHEAHRAQFVQDGFTRSLETFDAHEEKHAHVGAKYVRLDVGTSGAWMLELSTGDIYGIKGYGQVDRKKCVGNILDPAFNGAALFTYRFHHGRFDFRNEVKS